MASRKLFFIIAILIIATGVFAISSENGENSLEGELTISGAGNFECNDDGEWEQNGNVVSGLNCEIEGEVCCPSTASYCVEGVCSDTQNVVPQHCGDFTAQGESACNSGVPDPAFVYQLIEDRLTDEGVDFDPEDIATADFCINTNKVFTYEHENQCIVIGGPCTCEWNVEDSVCEGAYPEFQDTENTDCTGITDADDHDDDDQILNTECRTTSSPLEDNCESSGVYVLRWTAHLVQVIQETGVVIPPTETVTSPSCKDGQRTFSCSSGSGPEEQLPFFGMINFFVTFSLIFGIYLIIIILRRK